MKSVLATSMLVVVAVFIPLHNCSPSGYASGGYGGGMGYGGSYGGGMGYGGGYGGGMGYGGGYSAGGYGPKSSAADALKTSYNTQDGYGGYNFGYDVKDDAYYNYQSRYESGDPKKQVTGSYSLVEPDGSKRTVNYVADWVNGFKAIVSDKNGVTKYGYDDGYKGGDGGYGGGYSAPAVGYKGSGGSAY